MTELYLHMASVSDPLGVLHRLPCVGKQPLHLLLALHIILPALVAHAVLVRQFFPGLQAEQKVMGLGVLRIGVMHVIGSYQRNIQLLAHAKQGRIDRLLCRDSMILHLQKIIVLPEDFLIF